MRDFEKIRTEFEMQLHNYWKDFSIYMDDYILKIELLDEFQQYCLELSKIDISIAKTVTQLGIKFCKEKINTYRTGQANWIIAVFLKLKSQPSDLIPIEDERLIETFISAIGIFKNEPKMFSHNPGVSAEQTKNAHKKWWKLQRNKHTLAREYVTNLDKLFQEKIVDKNMIDTIDKNNELAIDRVVERIRHKSQCKKVLTRYLYLKNRFPSKSSNKLFEGNANFEGVVSLMDESQRSKYYKWLDKLEEEKNELKG